MLAKVAILAASATEVGRLTPEEDSEFRDGLEHDVLAQVVAQALDEAGL